ncbi:MAG: hypothetical protein Kow0025_13640 [Thermodesulfovibrionales bacterium]
MLKRLITWVEERWPLSAARDLLLEEEIPGGASWFYTPGSAVLAVFILQALTGVMQLFFYAPTVDGAYQSISHLRREVPFGWLIHGLHFWGAQFMVVLVLLHMARVFLWGAYKRPRELTWLAGVALLATVLAFSFTDVTLHWDLKGYWAGQVSTSIAGVVPVVGEKMKLLLRGEEGMGQPALSRFFGLHVGVLPAALLGIFAVHIAAVRKRGSVGPWKGGRPTGPFWPDQAFKDVVVGTSVLFLMLTLAVFAPPAYRGPADPMDTLFVPKPEWDFLWLYQALKYFEGPWEPLGAGGVPAAVMGALVLLPFVDRNPERNPLKRPVAMALAIALAGAVTALSVAGYLSKGYGRAAGGQAGVQGGLGEAASRFLVTEAWGREPGPEEGGDPARGGALFRNTCAPCHGEEGRRGIRNPGSARGAVPALNPISPKLTAGGPSGLAEAVERFILKGSRPEGPAPEVSMPSFGETLTRGQVADLVAYVMELNGTLAAKKEAPAPVYRTEGGAPGGTAPAPPETAKEAGPEYPRPRSQADPTRTGPAAYVVGSVEHGRKLYREHCARCHGEDGRETLPNPGSEDGRVPVLNPVEPELFSGDPDAFAENLDRFLEHGSVPEGPAPALAMPAFGDDRSLSEGMISNIIAYVMDLNGVDRARVLRPGMRPKAFYLLASGLYALAMLGLAGLWSKRRGGGG